MRIYNHSIEQTADLMKALADETRIRILNLLIERECCVCEVTRALSISQTRASRHMSQLHDAGLLELRRQGLWTIYYLAPGIKTDYRELIVKAVDNALSSSQIALTDRRRLIENGRLCPSVYNPASVPDNCA